MDETTEEMVDVSHYGDLARECQEAARNYEYTGEQFQKATDHAWKICEAAFAKGLGDDAAKLAGLIGYKQGSGAIVGTVMTDDIADEDALENVTPDMAYETPKAKKTRSPRKSKQGTTEPVQAAQEVTPPAMPKSLKAPREGTIKANILGAVVNSTEPVTAKTVATTLSLDVKQVGPILCRLVTEGHIKKAAGEGYEVAQ